MYVVINGVLPPGYTARRTGLVDDYAGQRIYNVIVETPEGIDEPGIEVETRNHKRFEWRE